MQARIQQLEEAAGGQMNKQQHSTAEQRHSTAEHCKEKEADQICNNITNDLNFSDEEFIPDTQV